MTCLPDVSAANMPLLERLTVIHIPMKGIEDAAQDSKICDMVIKSCMFDFYVKQFDFVMDVKSN